MPLKVAAAVGGSLNCQAAGTEAPGSQDERVGGGGEEEGILFSLSQQERIIFAQPTLFNCFLCSLR